MGVPLESSRYSLIACRPLGTTFEFLFRPSVKSKILLCGSMVLKSLPIYRYSFELFLNKKIFIFYFTRYFQAVFEKRQKNVKKIEIIFRKFMQDFKKPKLHLHMNLNSNLNISCNLSQTLVEKGCLASAELDNV